MLSNKVVISIIVLVFVLGPRSDSGFNYELPIMTHGVTTT